MGMLSKKRNESTELINAAIKQGQDACGGMALLNLGCGGRKHPSWINADLVPKDPSVLDVDVSAPLPFEENQFDAVFHAHMLEHLEPEVGARLMKECQRILRPGGVIRVSIPDFERHAREYIKNLDAAIAGEPGAEHRYDWSMLEMLDQLIRTRPGGRMRDMWMIKDHPATEYIKERVGGEYDAARTAFESFYDRFGVEATSFGPHDCDPPAKEHAEFRQIGEIHRWMYDRFGLSRLMNQVGFTATQVVGPIESRIPNWAEFGLESGPDGSMKKPDSLTVEAIKP